MTTNPQRMTKLRKKNKNSAKQNSTPTDSVGVSFIIRKKKGYSSAGLNMSKKRMRMLDIGIAACTTTIKSRI